VSRAKLAAPPASPVRQARSVGLPCGNCGLLAGPVRSNVKPAQVTEKAVNVDVSASYVKEPAVGATVPTFGKVEPP